MQHHHAHEVRRAVLDLPDEEAASESLELLQLSMAAITELQATLVTGFGDPTLSSEVARSLTAKTARLRRHMVRLAGMVEVTSHFAYHDQLTGLPNRALLTDRLQQAISLADRNHTQLALLFLDLDGFKAVNDRYGHAVGDKLLQHVAAMIQGCVRASDTACRFGGDEFVILLPDIAAAEGVPGLVKKILARIATPLDWHGPILVTTASIGSAVYPRDGGNAQMLIDQADAAMYRAKAPPRNPGKVTSRPGPKSTVRERSHAGPTA